MSKTLWMLKMSPYLGAGPYLEDRLAKARAPLLPRPRGNEHCKFSPPFCSGYPSNLPCRKAEQLRLPVIVANPEFAKNPFAAIRAHAKNALVKHDRAS
jgi:hypothetical protein